MGQLATSPVGKLSGGCLCGAVRFTVEPGSREFGTCHCSMCRRWTAGLFLSVECEDRFEIEDNSSLGVYRSSEWADRGFCKKCGTPLFYRLVGPDHYAVSLEALDDRRGFAFASEIFIEDKPPYYDFANDTRRMTGAEALAGVAASEGKSGA